MNAEKLREIAKEASDSLDEIISNIDDQVLRIAHRGGIKCTLTVEFDHTGRCKFSYDDRTLGASSTNIVQNIQEYYSALDFKINTINYAGAYKLGFIINWA